LQRFFQRDHGSDREGAEMRNTTKLSVDLAAAVQAIVDHTPQALTLAELVSAYDSHACGAESLRLRKWLAALGHLSAWEITTEQLSAAAQAMVDAGYKPSSPNRDLSALGTIYRWAIERRLPPRSFRSPTVGAKRFREDIRRIYVDASEVQALRRRSLAFPDRRFGVFVHLLLDTGARKSEIYLRRWREVSLQRCEILLPTSKTGKPRTLHFSDATRELIERIFPVRHDDKLIFEGLVPDQPINYRASWRKLTKEVGREDLRIHDSRHVVAAGMLKGGVSLPIAAQAIGNSPAVLAARYGHLETKTLREAVALQWTHQNS
jgi:integrase